ncbi:4'-phosphopantetheinyl transferase superfamily protein [[Mycoplasma] falconis]|uniref:4'-phosphopantetheinyl transferase superfamily protein n=1 Tax=[Mycoplasma] falconis TaxID=92403 RepID=A0A501XCK1_9BACT|nr:4'-phosphopantetheinyl transferase superfamily protein [[Mycoplasma] falconis]TPE58087.1 4'-phosphopantetheinyl transferase superfamily protein [[Mycoplasma] falconis]
MVGVDLTTISRFENLEEHTIKNILHVEEIKEYQKINSLNKAKYLATRWAIKEAIFKSDNNYSNFSKIKIDKTPEGRYAFENFKISTSNEGNLLIAFVVKI